MRASHIGLLIVSLVACDGTARFGAPPSPGASTAEPRTDDTGTRERKRFVPPDAAERLAAIGDVSKLPPELRKAFAPSDQYSAIPMPTRGMWLAEHRESGQTYDDYESSLPNRATGARRIIYIVPIGKFNQPHSPRVKMLADYVERYYGLPVKLLGAVRTLEVSRRRRINRNTGKPQLLTGEILEWLRARLAADAYCSIAVTETDLYPQASWNFVFGQAALRQRVGVFSFARYHPSFHGGKAPAGDVKALVLVRALKVMVHEIGHMFGMQHCTHFSCVMNGSNSMDESDSQPIHLCPVCLRKLHHARAYSPLKRYRRLQRFYHQHGLTEQAEWVSKRGAALR